MKKTGWLRLICCLIAAAAVLAGIWLWAQSEKKRKENNEYYETRIRQEKQWIMENRTPDGAILTYYLSADEKSAQESKRYMNPYFACIAARGLLCGDATAQEREAVKDYLSWHGQHLAADGSISDYDYYGKVAEDLCWQSRGKADSVDSYAALYLILISEYYAATDDAAFIEEQSPSIMITVDKLLEMQQEDGLTAVSDLNPIRYTMDNAEVNLALKDMVQLARKVPSLSGLLPRLQEALDRNTAAIATLLWDEKTGEYAVGLDAQGNVLKAADQSKIYPYWSAQVFPQLYGCEESTTAKSGKVYTRLCDNVPWTSLGFRKDSAASYWCAILYCAALNKDDQRVKEYLSAYDNTLGDSRNYPYYCAESGWAILAFDQMKY